MTQQALRELVAKWREEKDQKRYGHVDYWNGVHDALFDCTLQLESLLGEQREAQGEEYSRAINDVISIVAEMKESHTGYWADYLLGRLGMMASSAPPLAESVGDVRGEICRIVSEMLDNPGEDGIYKTTRCYDKLEALVRRHMQQGK